MSKLDKQIDELLKSVKVQQLEVSDEEKKSKVSWITTCSYEMNCGRIINIHVCNKDSIIKAMGDLIHCTETINKAHKELGLDEYNMIHNGFHYDDWVADFNKRLSVLSIKEKKQKLSVAETKLNGILSDDQRRQLELDDILSSI